jgi:hypothetical protein
VATAGLVVIAGGPFAVAAGVGDPLVAGGRTPSDGSELTHETEIIGNLAQRQGGSSAQTGGFTTRQSNKSDSGGGAIYGCRAKAGTEACVAANNLNTGEAFRFQAGEKAPTVGEFRFGTSLSKTFLQAPFQTNGLGMVKNLNAERVGNLTAQQIIAAAQTGRQGRKGDKGDPGERGPAGPPGQDATVNPTEFGVAKVFQGSTSVGTLWTPDVPDDGNNAAQASGSIVITDAQPNQVITVRGAFRSDESDGTGADDPAGEMGADIIATAIDGTLLAANVTDVNPDFTNTHTVTIDTKSSKTSGDPTTTSPELVSITLPGTLPADSTVILQGTMQAFDFGDDTTSDPTD